MAIAHYLHTHESFLIAPAMRQRLAAEILQRYPKAQADARTRGDRIVEGHYDLLGYRDLPFDGCSWHSDPVHGASSPAVFWSDVPYLDESCGDHKVIWEFNRHQHWLELGRAYWLTDDARYRAECLRQLESWLSANPPLIGINWASMLELGFRSLSWIWAANFFAAEAERDSSPWLVDLLLGIDRQLDHVERHLSYYFSPNTHLLGEGLALYVAGRALPMLASSRRRAATGRQVLLREIGRQIAVDGGHCERSPHYHRYALDFYLMALAVARLTDDPAAATFERACARLGHAARVLADDAGMLPLIGDDDGGSLVPITRRRPDDVRDSLAIAAGLTGALDLLVDRPHEEAWWILGHARFDDARQRIERLAPPVSPSSTALPATGYYVSRNDAGDHLIVDGGAHGYLNGGHAHADALSVTFVRRRRPVLIDTGTGYYTIDPRLRDRFRSTALHNTVTVDGQSQSSTRGPFHWRRMTDATTRRWRTDRRFDYFTGLHDGYAPLAHYRHVLMLHGDLLVVADCVTDARVAQSPPPGSPRDVEAAAHWHLHPQWSARVDGRSARLRSADDDLTLHVASGRLELFEADERTGLGWCAPVYGRVEPSTTLRISSRTATPNWVISVFTLDSGNPTNDVSQAPIAIDGNVPHHGAAIRIERHLGIDHVVIAEPHDDSQQLLWSAGEFESDARLLLAREVGERLTAVATVDGKTVRAAGLPAVEGHFTLPTTELGATLESVREKRKAS